jgi:hypothetical protein
MSIIVSAVVVTVLPAVLVGWLILWALERRTRINLK